MEKINTPALLVPSCQGEGQDLGTGELAMTAPGSVSPVVPAVPLEGGTGFTEQPVDDPGPQVDFAHYVSGPARAGVSGTWTPAGGAS